jgi:hypothetical protein
MKDGEGNGFSLFENIIFKVVRKTTNLANAPVEI